MLQPLQPLQLYQIALSSEPSSILGPPMIPSRPERSTQHAALSEAVVLIVRRGKITSKELLEATESHLALESLAIGRKLLVSIKISSSPLH